MSYDSETFTCPTFKLQSKMNEALKSVNEAGGTIISVSQSSTTILIDTGGTHNPSEEKVPAIAAIIVYEV